jgi:phosphoglycerate dehydrogenase-like enzyme
VKVALSGFWRAAMEPRLPADIEPAWFLNAEQASEALDGAVAAQLDLLDGEETMTRLVEDADALKWVACCFAGVDRFPLETMKRKGIRFTNGVGHNAVPVAEWAVMSVYALAKGFPDVVRMHDRKEWRDAPYGTVQVSTSKVLLIGYGHIGKEIARQLRGVGADVVIVRSKADPSAGVLGPDDWRARLGEFDFVILAAPGTDDTRHMIGADELRAMKKGAGLVNIGRGMLIDQSAFVDAMNAGQIGGAVLDPTEPEPLPADDPLWDAPNTVISAHLSGRSQTTLPAIVTDLFLENLQRFRTDEPLKNLVDLERGY